VHVGDLNEKVLGFYEEKSLAFPVLLDPETTVKKLYGIDAAPTVLVVGPDGRVALRTLWHYRAVEQEVKILVGLMKEEDRKTFEKGSG
jgi:hypothetical protein